jgi:hypothetical protein
METFYLPDPIALIHHCPFSIGNPKLRITKNAQAVFNKIINSSKGAEKILPELQNFEIDKSSSLSKNQVVYDNYFGVCRSSQNPTDVLESAAVKASQLLQLELEKGSNLSAVEISSLSSGLVTILSMLEPLEGNHGH